MSLELHVVRWWKQFESQTRKIKASSADISEIVIDLVGNYT